MSVYDSHELDEILSDVRRLLEAEGPGTPSQAPRRDARIHAPAGTVSDETKMYQPVRRVQQSTVEPVKYDGSGDYPWNDPDYIGTYYGGQQAKVVRSHAVHTAAPSAFDQPAEPLRRRSEASAGTSRTRPKAKQQEPAQARRERTERSRKPTKAQLAARQVLEDDEEDYEEPLPKKTHKGRKFLIFLIILALAAFGVYSLIAKQPKADDGSMGARKAGVSTILLAGVDEDGTRTDTLMLMNLNTVDHTASLVSIPRDTLVNGAYAVPKINGVYGINGGGKDGIEMLLQRVSECIGFMPDGYVLVDLDSFVDLVNIMGGVDFDVPVDMYYNDPAQNLFINLTAGEQHLDGEQAMGLVRFRSGYAAADLERVNVQRDFVSAAADQWMSPKLILKVPQLLAWMGKNVETDLSAGNMTWVAMALMRAKSSGITTETLPGSSTWISGGSYYVLNPYDVAETMNRCCNPYERDITVDDLSIRN